MTGEFGEAERRIALNAEVAIFKLRVRPGQLEGSAADIGVAVFGDQAHEFVTRLRRGRNERDLSLLPGFKRKLPLRSRTRDPERSRRSS